MMNEKRCKAPIYEPEKKVVFHAALRPLEAVALPREAAADARVAASGERAVAAREQEDYRQKIWVR